MKIKSVVVSDRGPHVKTVIGLANFFQHVFARYEG